MPHSTQDNLQQESKKKPYIISLMGKCLFKDFFFLKIISAASFKGATDQAPF